MLIIISNWLKKCLVKKQKKILYIITFLSSTKLFLFIKIINWEKKLNKLNLINWTEFKYKKLIKFIYIKIKNK